MAIGNMVGASVRRHEDPKLVTGNGNYVDDIKLPGMIHVGIVRSPYAHARVTGVNLDALKGAPGVVTALTGADIRKRQQVPLPITWIIPPDLKAPQHWAMATDVVRYVGEPVAVVAVESRYGIEDALDMVEVDYEPLEAVTGIEDALKEGAPILHPELGTNQAYYFKAETGDPDSALANAEVKIKQRLINQRLSAISVETRGIVAQYNKGSNELTVWSSTQTPHLTKHHLSEMFGIPEHNVRVVAPDVGGGFGSKLNILPEDFIVPLMAIVTGRPVKWIESRTENLQNTVHGRDMVDYIELGATRDGTITGLSCQVFANLGSYCRFFAAGLPILAGLMLPGNYKIPNFKVEIRTAYTNTLFVDAYRGAGRPEATYAIERAMDLLARELGMDPAELRRKNFVQTEDWPWTSASGLAYDSGDYVPTLDKALQISGYAQAKADSEEWNRDNPRVRRGVGIAAYVEIAGWGPGQATKGLGVANQLFGSATVRMDRSGTVEVMAGASGHGQGHLTSWAQIAADVLGVDHSQVKVYEGDTAMIQTGTGTFASRSLAVDGTAVHNAAVKVREKMLKIAAHQLEVDPEDLEIRNGMITVRGLPLDENVVAGGRLQTPEAAADGNGPAPRAVSVRDIAIAANTGHDLPSNVEPGLNESAFFDPVNFTYPYGVHIAEVDVDTESGEVTLRRYVAVDDCGNVINPMIVDGQVHGGVAQGVAQALWEEVVYDDQGQLLTSTLMDYGVPFSSDLPMIETGATITPSPVNPLGVKGVGEAGTIAATPVVVNAVMAALDGLGIRHIDMPLRPEKIWRALHSNNNGNSEGGA